MRSFSLPFLTIVLVIYFNAQIYEAHTHWWEGSSVLDLTTNNFYDYVGKDQNVIVEFFTPWCGYCRNMAAEYEALRQMYNGPDPKRKDVLIARINGNDHQQMSMRYNIYAYPAILFFPKGKKEYSQSFEFPYRTKEYFSRWIEELAGPEEKPVVEETKVEEKPVEEIKATVDVDQNLRSQKRQEGDQATNEPTAVPPNTQPAVAEQKNLTVSEQVHKIYDILVTLSDKINYIESEHSKKINEAIKSVEQLEVKILNVPKSNNALTRNGVIFLLIGFIFGIFVALCISKFKNVTTHHPELKTV